MRQKTSVIPYFFFSQALADGVRITFSILAPVLFFRQIGEFETGLAISLGAVCVNITDIPGPIQHKRNGLLIASACIFISSLLSVFFNISLILTGAIIAAATFIFSMFSIYGIRAGSVGSAGLLILILSLSNEETGFNYVLQKSGLVFAGALWYSAISLLLSTIRPYRVPQRALGECIRETAKFLSLKAAFYDSKTDLETNYRELLSQQIIVNDKQNDLRELLYKTRQIVKDTSGTGRSLLLTFVETIDLYEQITASYYNYEAIRVTYKDTEALRRISRIIRRLSYELNSIGFAIQANLNYKKNWHLYDRIIDFKKYVEELHFEKEEDKAVLRRIADNLESIYVRVHELGNYFEEDEKLLKKNKKLHSKQFVEHQEYSFEIFTDNLTLSSSAFRHSLRVTIACIIAFYVAHFLNYGTHGYWILITVVFIMKPAFGLTKKRNIERLTGTAIGGVIGIAILHFFPGQQAVFIFLLVTMLGTYTFMRINYITMVIFTTPYVLIMFKLLGYGHISVIEERIIDTAIGCFIALTAGYLLFPKWEAEQLEDHVHNVLKANLNYLRNFALRISGKPIEAVNYKLARKEVFVSSANLSAAFQRMLSEPRKKQKNSDKVYEFVVLNHVLSSNIAGLSAETINNKQPLCTGDEQILLNKIQLVLFDCLNASPGFKAEDAFSEEEFSGRKTSTLKGQLEFILRLCNDIYKARKLIRN